MSEWADDCKLYRGRVLTGTYAHWCCEWDGLPIDETCIEWPCCSYEPEGITEEQKAEAKQVSERVHQEWDAAEAVALNALTDDGRAEDPEQPASFNGR